MTPAVLAQRSSLRLLLAAAFSALVMTACGGGGGSSTPTTPTPPVGGGGGGGTSAPTAATMRLTSSGVTPREVTIAVGGRVTFVNERGRSVAVSSDPHPVHTDCPAINQAAPLPAGQSRDTGAFSQARRCGFHDHDNPDDDSLRGTIVVQ